MWGYTLDSATTENVCRTKREALPLFLATLWRRGLQAGLLDDHESEWIMKYYESVSAMANEALKSKLLRQLACCWFERDNVCHANQPGYRFVFPCTIRASKGKQGRSNHQVISSISIYIHIHIICVCMYIYIYHWDVWWSMSKPL